MQGIGCYWFQVFFEFWYPFFFWNSAVSLPDEDKLKALIGQINTERENHLPCIPEKV